MKVKPGKLSALFLAAVTLLTLFIACSPPAGELSPPAREDPFPIEITDQAGKVVRLVGIPQRIVSLAPSNTEILFALGLGERIVAVTDFCDYPPEAREKPSIGGYTSPNIEEIVALSPDLIFATNVHEAEITPALERLGLSVFTLAPNTLDEVLEAVSLVGEVTGNKKQASQLVAGMRNRIKAVTDKTDRLSPSDRPRVLYVLWHDPLMTAGSSTRIDELIVKAGGINIAQDLAEQYPKISLEAVLERNPQVIIAASGHGTSRDLPFRFATTEPRLKDITARLDNRIYEVDGDLTSRPGPRIVAGLEKVAEFIHPELFKETR